MRKRARRRQGLPDPSKLFAVSRVAPRRTSSRRICVWINKVVIWYNAKHFYEMPPQPDCWFPPSPPPPPKTRASTPPLPKMSTTCEYEDNSVQLESNDEPATGASTSAPASPMV